MSCWLRRGKLLLRCAGTMCGLPGREETVVQGRVGDA